MLTIIICALITGIIVYCCVFDYKSDPLIIFLILVSMVLGAEIGSIIAAGVGCAANEQNSQIAYIEKLELNSYNNIYIKTEKTKEDKKYLSITDLNSFTSYEDNTVIKFDNTVIPYVEIKHTNPPKIIQLFGILSTTEYYYYTIPENGII